MQTGDESRLASEALARTGVSKAANVVDVRRFVARRPVLLATLDDDRHVLLKWLHDDQGAPSDNEPVMLRLLAGLRLAPVLRAAVPQLVHFDPAQQLMVLEGFPRSQTLGDTMVEGGEPSAEHLVHLAAVLASLHGLEVGALRRTHPDRSLFLPVPPMLDLTPAEFALGPGTQYATYAKTVQSVDAELRALHAAWACQRLIHFDVRDDNVLLGAPGTADAASLWLVDWELAGFGDPLYDVGTVVGQLVHHGLAAASATDDPVALPRFALGCFVQAYVRMAARPLGDALPVIMSYAGVFLLLRALALLQTTGSLSGVGKLSLLVGRRFLSCPRDAAKAVLG